MDDDVIALLQPVCSRAAHLEVAMSIM